MKKTPIKIIHKQCKAVFYYCMTGEPVINDDDTATINLVYETPEGDFSHPQLIDLKDWFIVAQNDQNRFVKIL